MPTSPQNLATYAKPIRSQRIFMRVVERLQNKLRRNPHRQFAYALLDKDRAAAFLAAAPWTHEFPKPGFRTGRAPIVAIVGWDDDAKAWHVAGINAPSKIVIRAMKELGDVLGILAARTAGDPRRLDAALQWLLDLSPECHSAMNTHPLLADAFTQSALAATDPAASPTRH
jgi:hypothetical protein